MAANIKKYFAGGNTCKGFYSLYDSALQGLERIFIIKGGPGTGKSTLMRNISFDLAERGYDVEHLHCSSDPNSLDGIIMRELSIGIVDGTAPHVIEPKNPGIVEEIVNLGDCWDRNKLLPNKTEIAKISFLIQEEFAKAYGYLSQAKDVYDDLKNHHHANMDFKRVDCVTQQLIDTLFRDHNPPFVRQMFFSAITPEGFVEFVDNLTKHIEKRFIIKGSPGTGKSSMMTKIAKIAEELRFDVEIYRCGFDPDSIGMVIIPNLGVAILDGGREPYVVDQRKGDIAIDLYSGLNQDVLKGMKHKLANLERDYNELINNGVSHIAKAKQYHQEKEKYYIEAMDFEKVNDKKLSILKEILATEKR